MLNTHVPHRYRPKLFLAGSVPNLRPNSTRIRQCYGFGGELDSYGGVGSEGFPSFIENIDHICFTHSGITDHNYWVNFILLLWKLS